MKRIDNSTMFMCSIIIVLVFLHFNYDMRAVHTTDADCGGLLSSSVISGNFTNFVVEDQADFTPDCRVQVRSLNSGVLPGTEEFGFNVDGDEIVHFSTAHGDNFSSAGIQPWWDMQNEDYGEFIQQDGLLVISSIVDAEWGMIGPPTIRRNAPTAFQTVTHDFQVRSRLDVGGFDPSGNAGLLLHWGSNFMKFFYKRGYIGLIYVIDEEQKPVKLEPVEILSDSLWLSVTREKNMFRFSYSLDGADFSTFFERLLKTPTSMEIGLYAACAAVLKATDWDITPSISCTGVAGSENTEMVIVQGVPFKNWNNAGNIIQFRIDLANSTTIESPKFNVSLSVADDRVQFSETIVNDARKDNISLSINVLYPSSCLVTPGTETYILCNQVPSGPPEEGCEVNPHADDFNADILSLAWDLINDVNGTIKIEAGTLEMNSSSSSNIQGTSFDAPYVFQRVRGTFKVKASILETHLGEADALVGLMLVDGTAPIANIFVRRVGFQEEVVVNRYREGILVDSNQLFFPEGSIAGAFSLGISKDLNTTEFFIEVNNTSLVASRMKLDKDIIFKVGFFASGGAGLVIDRWEISPSISANQNPSSGEYSIRLDGLSVPTIYSSSHVILFNVGLSDGNKSCSNFHALEPCDDAWDGKGLLVNYGFDTIVVTPTQEIEKSIPGTGQLDAEQLSNGNVIIAKGTVASGSVVEYNSYGSIVREVTSAGGMNIIWPHDIDVLPCGNWLITDTMNDRVVEIDDAGNVVWKWLVWDYFQKKDAREGRSHVNDADRLPNGNTLVSLRNLDTVVEINPGGDIIWSFGRLGMFGNLSEPHNPDRLEDGTTMICDSKNGRLVRVSFNGTVVWEYHGPEGSSLGWVRDADVLPGGNVLVADGADESKPGTMSRILEIHASTGDVVWSFPCPKPVYNVDIVDLHALSVFFLSPVDAIQNVSCLIPIALNANQRNANIYFQIFDETTGKYLDQNPKKYLNVEYRLLEDEHSYTIYAWAETNPGAGPDPVNGGDYHPVRSQTINFSFSIDLVQNLSLIGDLPVSFMSVSSLGEVSWRNHHGQELHRFTPLKALGWIPLDVRVNDIEVTPNGSIVLAFDVWLMNGTNATVIIEMDGDGNLDWAYSAALDGHELGFSDVDYLARNDTFIVVSGIHGCIFELKRDFSIDIIWNATVFKDQRALGQGFLDNLRLDDVSVISDDTFSFTIPSDNSVLKINRSGEIAWILNNTLNGSTLDSPRNLIMLKTGEIMLLNGTPSHLVKIAASGSVVWDSVSVLGLSGMSFSRVLPLPNGQVLSIGSCKTNIARFSIDGTVHEVVFLDHDIENLEPVLYPTPVFQLLGNTEKIFHENDVTFTIAPWINITIDSLHVSLYNVTGETWIFNGDFVLSQNGTFFQFSSRLQDGSYVLEIKSNVSIPAFETHGSDVDLYLDGMESLWLAIPFSVDVIAWNMMAAPCLVEGRLLLSNTKERLLSWSPCLKAENYTVYAHDSLITEINGSIQAFATTNKSWYKVAIHNDFKNGLYFVVVANNRMFTSPPSNVLHLTPRSPAPPPWSGALVMILNSTVLVGVLWAVYRNGLQRREPGKKTIK
nr:aryl-sulfate sulfotransferase [Candidatus Sigynarchaeota archaeon]